MKKLHYREVEKFRNCDWLLNDLNTTLSDAKAYTPYTLLCCFPDTCVVRSAFFQEPC